MQKTLLFQMLCIQVAKTKPTLRGLYTDHCIFTLSFLPFSQCHYQKTLFLLVPQYHHVEKKDVDTFLLGEH